MTTAVHLHIVSVMHTTPLPPHMQQELVTSRIIPEFAEEVAEGGEMVSQEAGRNVGEKGEKERVFMLITLMVISLYSSA